MRAEQERADSKQAINQADTEFHRVRTELHGVDSKALRAAGPAADRGALCEAIFAFSVKLCVHFVKLCVRLITLAQSTQMVRSGYWLAVKSPRA